MAYSEKNRSTSVKVRDLLRQVRSLDEIEDTNNVVEDNRNDGVDEVDSCSLLSIDGVAVASAAEAAVNKVQPQIENGNKSSDKLGRNMSIEVDRLATYKNWPNKSPMNPTTLAKAGFFYSGNKDMVECFSCNGKIQEWEFGDSAIGEHKRFFPKCKFVQGKDVQNQPLLLNQTSPREKPEVAASKEDDLFNPKKDTQPKNRSEFSDELKSEYRRLLTFQTWPRVNPMLPRSLTKAGFFYTQVKDAVKCFTCGGEISNWKASDVPMTQHTMLFPDCPFVQGEDVGNEKLTTTDVMNAQHASLYQQPSTRLPPTQKVGLEKGQVSQTAKVMDQSPYPGQPARRQLTRAQHPQFGIETERLKTFKSWPPSAPPYPLLAKAGFFYTGENDNVKCFYCNGGLRNWEPSDDPWTEHAKWFPKCDWLLQQRGEPFVQYVITNFPVPNQNLPLPPPSPAIPSGGAHQGTARPVFNLNTEQPLHPSTGNRRGIDERMQSAIVRSVIEMGFSLRKIRRIIERQIRNNENEFNSIQTFVDAILNEPDQREDNEGEPTGSGSGKTADSIPKTKQFEEDEQARAADKTKELETKMSSLSVGNPGPNSESGFKTLEDESELPSSIQHELRELRDKRTCKICMDNEINVLFMPCGHLVTCETCSRSIQVCPICRKPIQSCIKTYLS
ncbi:baculoviral IAP repeat-containing protein 7-like [Antedon mediterranea]|uniref:baculoviral IAP repeat-containing protein 7-like n=1 Tax=Antedon mediterranea TaxID=105859 RepID=UPI003AF7611C